MPTTYKKTQFFDSEEGVAAEQTLQSMVADKTYHTEPTYSANTAMYPNNLISFVDKHMCYLRDHPTTNPRHYLSNLRLITRIH